MLLPLASLLSSGDCSAASLATSTGPMRSSRPGGLSGSSGVSVAGLRLASSTASIHFRRSCASCSRPGDSTVQVSPPGNVMTGGVASLPVMTAFPPSNGLAFHGMPRSRMRLVNRSPSTGPMLSNDEVGRCRNPLNQRSSIVGLLSPFSSIFRAPAMWSLSMWVIISISIFGAGPRNSASGAAVLPTPPSMTTRESTSVVP